MEKQTIFFNKTIDKDEIKRLIDWFLRSYGSIRTRKLLDGLKTVGFTQATNAGVSIGIGDLLIPKVKSRLLKNTQERLEKNDINYITGKIQLTSNIEGISENWNATNEILKNEVLENFRQTNLLNPVYMMTLSGARGNISQIKQLVGMRGLMSDSQGELINLPIKSNFKEGLNLVEYFISCYGARKGLVDTALKTANSGYLTRRLIYVSQSQIIKKPDCKTSSISIIFNYSRNKKEYNKTKQKLLGRVIGKSLKKDSTGKVIAALGQDICNV